MYHANQKTLRFGKDEVLVLYQTSTSSLHTRAMNTNPINSQPSTFVLLPEYDDLPQMPLPTSMYCIPETIRGQLAIGTTQYCQNYFLDARAVFDGAHLEVLMAGRWLRGLFSWSYDLLDLPKLVFLSRQGCEHQPNVVLTSSTLCRWIEGCDWLI